QIMLALEKPAAGRSTDIVAPLDQVARLVRRRGLMVMISDFLAPLDRLEPALLTLSAAGHEAAVFQVLDPAEKSLSFSSPAMFEDMETARSLFIDPATVRDGYRRNLEAHCDAVRAVCRRHGISYAQHVTDQPLELALFEFL